MAREFGQQYSVSGSKNGQSINGSGTTQTDMTDGNTVDSSQDIGTSWEALTWGDIASISAITVINKDASHYVEVATANDGTGIFGYMAPAATAGQDGGHCQLQCKPGAPATYYARANTASCRVKKLAV